MRIIAHRGNVTGPCKDENCPEHIDKAISLGYDVEVDVYVKEGKILLGHDEGMHKVNMTWLTDRKSKLWVHCKNFDALSFFSHTNFNYFYHINDPYTITSLGYIWTYPGQQLGNNFVLVMPETAGILPSKSIQCFAVCSDYSHEWEFK